MQFDKCPICNQMWYCCSCSNELWDEYYRKGKLDDYLNDVDWSNVKITVQRYVENPNVAPMTEQEYFDQFKDDE